MNRANKIKTRKFSLVELMVAMAILIIMMGFLFQFTIGAQRIWKACTSDTDTFADAQILMQCITDDLQSMIFAGEEANPDAPIPFILQLDVTDDKDNTTQNTCWMTSNQANGVPYFVIYQFDSGKKTLKRLAIENSSTNEDSYAQALIGARHIDSSGKETITKYINNAGKTIDKNVKISSCTISRNIKSLTFTTTSDCLFDESNYLKKAPNFMLLRFIIEQPSNNNPEEKFNRIFSKIIFLQGATR